MNNMREIVTKAVITKLKKSMEEEYKVSIDGVDNVLGCWVINHKFNGELKDNVVTMSGNYDVNIWYSYDNNTKTNVLIKNFTYDIPLSINYKNNIIPSNCEVIIKCLNQPTVIEAFVEDDNIVLKINSLMGIEILGDTTLKVNISNIQDEYEEIIDDDINPDYLN